MDDLYLAIQNRNVIEFRYNGKNRIVEPHTFGINATGIESLSAYQVGGESNSKLPDWREFFIKQIEDLEVTDNTFEPEFSHGYKQGSRNTRFSKIYCEA